MNRIDEVIACRSDSSWQWQKSRARRVKLTPFIKIMSPLDKQPLHTLVYNLMRIIDSGHSGGPHNRNTHPKLVILLELINMHKLTVRKD